MTADDKIQKVLDATGRANFPETVWGLHEMLKSAGFVIVPTDAREQLAAIMPPPDSDERKKFLKLMIEVTADALVEHSAGKTARSLVGLGALYAHGRNYLIERAH